MSATGVRPPGSKGWVPAEARPTDKDRVLPPAPVPRRTPGVGYLGMLLSVLLAALGVLALYEGMVLLGWIDADPVLTPLLDGTAAITPDAITALLAGLAVLVGLWLLWTALKRSRRPGVQLAANTGVWMTYTDLSRLVAGTAEDCDGVLAATASVSRRRATVECETTTAGVREGVQDAVSSRLSALASPPRVTVRVHPRHGEEGGVR